MLKAFARLIVATALELLPLAARAEPITFKLSFFTSDRSVAYQTAVKPFVDAVNSEGEDLLEINVYFSGTLGKVQRELPQTGARRHRRYRLRHPRAESRTVHRQCCGRIARPVPRRARRRR